MKLSELQLSKSICHMNYGAAGTGKTFFLATAPPDHNMAIVTDLNGMATLQNSRVRKLYPNFNPEIEVIEDDDSVTDAKAFYAIQKAAERLILNPDIHTVCIDDASFTRRAASRLAVKLNSMDEKSKTEIKLKDMKGHFAPTQADMGREMAIVETFLDELTRACRRAGKHLIVNAHERYIYRKDKELKVEVLAKTIPHFTGRTAPESLLGYFDTVFRLVAGGVAPNNHVDFHTKPNPQVAAKDRYEIFAAKEKNLTWAEVLSRVSSLSVRPNQTSESK